MVVVNGTPDNTSSLVWSAWLPRWWRTLFLSPGHLLYYQPVTAGQYHRIRARRGALARTIHTTL